MALYTEAERPWAGPSEVESFGVLRHWRQCDHLDVGTVAGLGIGEAKGTGALFTMLLSHLFIFLLVPHTPPQSKDQAAPPVLGDLLPVFGLGGYLIARMHP